MHSFELARGIADEALNEAGFHEKSLAEHNLPQAMPFITPDGAAVDVVTFGSPDAPFKLLEGAPYLTRVNEDHYKLRLKAHSVVLGPEVEVIGVGQYDPKKADLGFGERRKAAHGDFSPFSERFLYVADALDLRRAAGVLIRGYSFAADAGVQTAHDVMFDPNRGAFHLAGLSAEEIARCEDRGAIAVTSAMNASGKRLAKNILASDVPALNEAWGIPESADYEAAKKAVDSRVNASAVRYLLGDLRSNLALTRGFGTGESVRQLNRLAMTPVPLLVHRQGESTVFTEESFNRFVRAAGLESSHEVLEAPNDHSRDDNIRASAASVLIFAASSLPEAA